MFEMVPKMLSTTKAVLVLLDLANGAENELLSSFRGPNTVLLELWSYYTQSMTGPRPGPTSALSGADHTGLPRQGLISDLD